MARAYQQSQPTDTDHDPHEWSSLRQELVALLDQVDNQVARSRTIPQLNERVQDMRHQVVEQGEDRHRDALRSVQRAIHRFEEPLPPQAPPNPRDSLQAAINQIRARQGQPANTPRMPPLTSPAPQPAPPPRGPAERALDAALIDKLAASVTGLGGRLERLEGEIKAQIKTGANVKDVADQVAQLANVVELLAGAVGETGQVKRLEGQIASLGKIISQGREMDIQTLTRRLDDVASTVGKLAELQVHYADRVQNPVESQAFQDGMRSIEDSVRSVYDRIDALERQRSLRPEDLDQITAEMARFTEALRDGTQGPANLVELIDALNTRISDIESGDRLLHGLRKDLNALRDAVIVSLAPRFDAIEQHMQTLSTREDMAEIGRQIGALGDRIGERPIDPGIGQLEAQVRQLVARMDQTGEQLSGLAKLYHSEPVQMPDVEAMAEIVAARATEAMQRTPVASDPAIANTIEGLEQRITAMLQTMQRDPEVDAFDGMQASISEVNERLRRLEASLLERSVQPDPDLVRKSDLASIIADVERSVPLPAPAPRRSADTMLNHPSDDAPLTAAPFPEPSGPIASALEARGGHHMRHPGLDEDIPLAARYDTPAPPTPPAGFEPDRITVPAAPQPSLGFTSAPVAAPAPDVIPVTSARTNTFIEAARRAAQRQQPAKTEVNSNSLIGRALSRFHVSEAEAASASAPAPAPAPTVVKTKVAARKAARTEPIAAPEPAPTPAVETTEEAALGASVEARESFLSRHRKAILLAAAVVALGFLTANLVAQRMSADEAAPATATPTTTGDITGDVQDAPTVDDSSTAIPPRVIQPADTAPTGSINSSAAQGFSTSPLQPMPNSFAPVAGPAAASPEVTSPALASPLAMTTPDAGAAMPSTPAADANASAPVEKTADAAAPATTPAIAPLIATPDAASPVKVDPPPDNVGPADLRQAAADGDPRAQFEVAAIYTEGRAVPQDYKAAATWYERAAAQGFVPAEYRLGSLYESGSGVSKDLNAAKLWYERAAEAGNRMSMHNLAALYAGGQLGKQQFDSAAKWFESAAKLGLTDSQFNLGMLYARGLGVPQNLNDSYKWFAIAALSGDKDAAKARDDIARSLDADTVSKLTAEVTAFKPDPIDLKANFAPIGTWSKTFDAGQAITSKDIVTNVQKALGRLGYDVGSADGVAGKKTADAIKAFEAGTGMNQTGQINPRLLAVLGSQPV